MCLVDVPYYFLWCQEELFGVVKRELWRICSLTIYFNLYMVLIMSGTVKVKDTVVMGIE